MLKGWVVVDNHFEYTETRKEARVIKDYNNRYKGRAKAKIMSIEEFAHMQGLDADTVGLDVLLDLMDE